MPDAKIFVPAPDRAPPSNTLGPVAWVRKSIWIRQQFSCDTVILLSIFSYVPPFVEWALINANWTGTDRSICEAIPQVLVGPSLMFD